MQFWDVLAMQYQLKWVFQPSRFRRLYYIGGGLIADVEAFGIAIVGTFSGRCYEICGHHRRRWHWVATASVG